MKNKEKVIEFLEALGVFKGVRDWDDQLLEKRLKEVPLNVPESKVPKGFEDFYHELIAEATGVSGLFAMDTSDLRALVDERGLDVKLSKAKGDDAKLRHGIVRAILKGTGRPAKKAGKAAAKEKAQSKEKKKGKDKRERKRPAREPKERDEHGSAVGTIRYKVNAALSKDWKSEEDIVKDAGVPARSVRIRLRNAVRHKLVERQRTVQYRWKPGKK